MDDLSVHDAVVPPEDPVVADILQRMRLQPGVFLQTGQEASRPVDDLDIESLSLKQREDVFAVVASMVDLRLKAAVRKHGLMSLLREFAAGRNVDGLDCQEFLALWERNAEQEWLKERFRDLRPAHHEWIPTNLLRSVFERARREPLWLTVHDCLRSPTGDVIFSWEKVAETVSDGGSSYTILNGHVGAVYFQHEQQTRNQTVFHDELRAAFEAESGIRNCLKALQSVARGWLWDGRELLHPLHPALCESRDKPFDIKALLSGRSQVFASTLKLFDSP